MDYHFERNELYLTLTDKIQRYNVSVTETGTGTLEIALLNMNSETLYTAPSGNTLGSITIDWVYNITYWIEFEGSTTKVTYCVIILKTTNTKVTCNTVLYTCTCIYTVKMQGSFQPCLGYLSCIC